MDEKLTDRAQAYWETMDDGLTIDAEGLFEVTRRPKDLGEDIKYVRGFLTRKCNDGKATLLSGQSPPTYRKLTQWNSITDVCTCVFNDIPDSEVMTIVTFTNKLPQIFRDKKNEVSVRSFLYRAKLAGAAINVPDKDGAAKYDGRNIVIQKQKNIEGTLPTRGRVRQAAVKTAASPTSASEEQETILDITAPISPEKMAADIFDMKASQVGMSIFSLLHKLMTENAEHAETIKVQKELMDDALAANKKLVAEHNELVLELKELRDTASASEDKTFREIISESE